MAQAGDYEHEDYGTDGYEVPFVQVNPGHLGSGGCGVVDKVKGTRGHFLNQLYARKVILLDRADPMRGKMKSLIKKEVENLTLARHGHVVKLFMTYICGNEYAIIMELADGSLEGYLKDEKLREQIPQWYGCLLGAVAFVHEKSIRHRDIKPANILIKDGNILLTDFGISMMHLGTTFPTTVLDAPRARSQAYCAPEVEEGRTRGRSADMFSLGAVFLEMLLAYSYPNKFQELRISTSGSNKSYAKNITEIHTSMAALKLDIEDTSNKDPQLVWRSTILSFCNMMLQPEREDRPKSGDLHSLWLNQKESGLSLPRSCSLCSDASR